MKQSSVFLISSSLIVAFALFTAANYYEKNEFPPSSDIRQFTADAEDTDRAQARWEERDGVPDIRQNIQHQSAKQQFMSSGGGTAEDQRILREIGQAIRESYGRFNMGIQIDNGVVTISGVVKTQNDILDIQNTILRIRGVKSVNNQLSALEK